MYRTPIKNCSSTFGSCECILQENHFEDNIDSSGICWDDNQKMKPSILEEEYHANDPFPTNESSKYLDGYTTIERKPIKYNGLRIVTA